MFNSFDDDKERVSIKIVVMCPEMLFNWSKQVVFRGINPVSIYIESEIKLCLRFPDVLFLADPTCKQVYNILAPTIRIMKYVVGFRGDGASKGVRGLDLLTTKATFFITWLAEVDGV